MRAWGHFQLQQTESFQHSCQFLIQIPKPWIGQHTDWKLVLIHNLYVHLCCITQMNGCNVENHGEGTLQIIWLPSRPWTYYLWARPNINLQNHYVVHLKLMQYCKSTILQKKCIFNLAQGTGAEDKAQELANPRREGDPRFTPLWIVVTSYK